MTAANPAAQDPYLKLGVRPFIHCAGVRTIHGGSLMLPEVSRAMELAARRFVNIDELMAAVSRRIAELTGAEAGIVTSGCAAALCHATAAALTGADPERMLRLPDTSGLQAKVVMPSTGRFTYDHAIRMTGAKIVEVDSLERLEQELDEGAAMVALLAAADEKGAAAAECRCSSTPPRKFRGYRIRSCRAGPAWWRTAAASTSAGRSAPACCWARRAGSARRGCIPRRITALGVR